MEASQSVVCVIGVQQYVCVCDNGEYMCVVLQVKHEKRWEIADPSDYKSMWI